jgi:hypothetical protein
LGGDWRLVLATRSLPGDESPDGRAHVLDVGEFQVDEGAEEIDIMPTCFMAEGAIGLRVSQLASLITEMPNLADFQLSGIVGVKHLADGGRAQRSDGIIGSYILSEDKEYWLLLAPESQWSPHWFGT